MNDKSVQNAYNTEEFDILKVKAEDLAAFLTLRDLPVFKRITAEELTSGAWAQKTKNQHAPNIAEFTYRFNVICLWTQKEILSALKLSRRVLLIEYFIKVAKKLLLLNNIHGAFAVTSALLSHPVFRLSKSWMKVGWHEKSIFDKLKKLFAADNNWENLRKLTDSQKTPCIPHIGIYLTDLMFIQNAIKQKHIPLALGDRGIHQSNIDALIRTLASFQDSVYDELESNPSLERYFSAINIDRDRIRFEEDQLYNLSLLREPQDECSTPRQSSLSRLSRLSFKLTRSSTPKISTDTPTSSEVKLDPQLKTKSLTPNLSLLKGGTPKFKKGHKKTYSYGDAATLGIDNNAFTQPSIANASHDSLDDFLDNSCFDKSLNNHIPEVQGDLPIDNSPNADSYRLDSPDCLCDSFGSLKLPRNSPRSLSVFGSKRHLRFKSLADLPFERRGSLNDNSKKALIDNGNSKADIEGLLYRSTVRSSKSKPVLLRYSQRIYAELHQNCLFEFERKTLVFHMNVERDLFKAKPRRIINLQDSSWKIVRSFASSDSFELHQSHTGSVIVYRCPNSYLAAEWVNKLLKAAEDDASDVFIHL